MDCEFGWCTDHEGHRDVVTVKDATLDLLRAFGIKKGFGNPGSS